jgi:tetrapyrrole methylase family protein / MazG family protein
VTGRVSVVGLGPGGPDLVTAGTLHEIERIPERFLRTIRHPSATAAAGASSFDEIYERADRIDDVYAAIVETLVAAATDHGEVLYAVPGSPRVAERTVELLVADGRADVVVHPALSFVDLAWVRLGVDPLTQGARIVDGHEFAVGAAGETGPMLVAQCDTREVLSTIKLAADDGPDVQVLHHLGLPDESVTTVAWNDLDRLVEPDHLTSLWVPPLTAPVASELTAFAELVRTLRERCPWDAEQTHRTLTRHLLEETYELLEAIEAMDEKTGAGYELVEEELGDVLFQVFFHATLASEAGAFTLADVARGVHDKLVHRHPHVFAGVEVAGPDEVVQNWEQLKKAEKGRSSVMDGIPGNLPALLYAHKVLRKASSAGVEIDPAKGVVDDEQLGALLLSIVDAARRAELDPEAALRAAAARVRDETMTRETAARESST